MAGLKRLLVLWVFGYFKPGTAAAAAHGVRQPFGLGCGACPSFGPSRSHCFGPWGGGTLFCNFRLLSIHISLKTMDIPGRKIAPKCLESERRLLAPSRCTRYVFGRPTADHVKRSLSPLCRAWSRRLPAPLPSVEGRSVFGARASPGLREECPGDERSRRSPSRQPFSIPVGLGPAVSNLGPVRNVGGVPRIQNPAQCCQYVPC